MFIHFKYSIVKNNKFFQPNSCCNMRTLCVSVGIKVTCASIVDNEATTGASAGDWAVCLDPKFSLTHRMKSKHCRVYSFGWV